MTCYEPNTVEQFYAAKYFCENFKDTDVESFEIYYPHAAGSHCLSIAIGVHLEQDSGM